MLFIFWLTPEDFTSQYDSVHRQQVKEPLIQDLEITVLFKVAIFQNLFPIQLTLKNF